MSARVINLDWSQPAFATGCDVAQGEAVQIVWTPPASIDITGWTLLFTCKRFHTDVAPLFTLTPSNGGANGVFSVTLTPAQTAVLMYWIQGYQYDVWRTDPGSETLMTMGTIALQENVRVSV